MPLFELKETNTIIIGLYLEPKILKNPSTIKSEHQLNYDKLAQKLLSTKSITPKIIL